MRILILRTTNFTPPEKRQITIKYLVDQEYTIKRAWGEALVARGRAKEIAAPPRPVEAAS